MERYKKYLRKKKAPWVLIAVGVVGLGISVILVVKDQPKPPAGVSVKQAPSAVKPNAHAVANYSVAPDLPKYISIPTIAVNQARVIGIGLTNGQIGSPDNIYDTGWYTGSAKPGRSGAMFIYGHVSSWQANGVFYNLKELRPGDSVTITRGDNAVFRYQVVSSKVYPYDHVDMNQVLAPVNPGTPGLNLMTCTGQVIKGTSEFNERLVVFTKLMK